jgi:Ca2+:H+ antiporter
MIIASATAYVRKNPLSYLFIALPLALLSELTGWGAVWTFVFSAIGVVPLAGLIGEATESLAAYTNPRVGGLLNATLGNAAELIITLMAIRAGLLELVLASITGSIIGNLLLVLGFAMTVGSIKNGIQTFDRRQSSNRAILLVLAVLALAIPTIFNHAIATVNTAGVEELSLSVAGIMIVLYVVGLIFSLRFNDSPLTYASDEDEVKTHHWSIRTSLLVLLAATLGVVWLSELLVGTIEPVVASLGISEFFIGIILVPIVGNAAEHVVAVQVASKNKMDLAVEIAVSSSIQIALLVAPLLVFISLLMGHPLTIVFSTFELIAVGAAVLVTVIASSDGESNWLEGAALIAVYVMLGISFFLLPASQNIP